MTLEQFVKKYGLTATIKEAKNQEDKFSPAHVKHVVKVKSDFFPGKLKGSYQFNPSHTEFHLLSYLECIQMEYLHENDFGDWCLCFGYDEDPGKGLEIFKACKKQTKKMKQFFGFEIEEFLACEP